MAGSAAPPADARTALPFDVHRHRVNPSVCGRAATRNAACSVRPLQMILIVLRSTSIMSHRSRWQRCSDAAIAARTCSCRGDAAPAAGRIFARSRVSSRFVHVPRPFNEAELIKASKARRDVRDGALGGNQRARRHGRSSGGKRHRVGTRVATIVAARKRALSCQSPADDAQRAAINAGQLASMILMRFVAPTIADSTCVCRAVAL